MIQLPSGNRLFDFQDDTVTYLMSKLDDRAKNDHIVLKSPTGSGKTIMLIAFIDRYLEFNPSSNTSFIWLTPGSGDLEEQSKHKMEHTTPQLDVQYMQDILSHGFKEGTTSFINWEQVTKKNNKSITEGERKNLFDHITSAHREGRNFILIIDEEHSNRNSRAQDIINACSRIVTIRVSATAKFNTKYDWYEITEEEVILSGLIRKALYINKELEEQLDEKIQAENETSILLDLAESKRQQIIKEYKRLNKNIRPLVIIQFPSSSTALIENVENYLSNMGYSYENKMVAKWMADENDKINLDGIEKLDAEPAFLLIKQAIATGWDSPRSQILVKLRENMSEDFEIQTIGRIRRMPEAKHYDNEILDC